MTPEENYKLVEDLYKEIEECKTVALDNVVCILTCQNRKPSLLDTLSEITSDVYVYIYESEEHLYEWLEQENVTKVCVPDAYRSCQKMRHFIGEHMSECPDKMYWELDDDLLCGYVSCKTKKTSVWKTLKVTEGIIKHCNAYDYEVLQVNMCDISAKFWNGKYLIRGCEFPHQCMLINKERLENLNIRFTGDATVHEDVELAIEVYKKGGKLGAVEGVLVTPLNDPKKSIASNDEHLKDLVFDGYQKFGEWCKLVPKKNREVLQVHVNRPNCKNEKKLKYDKELLRLCKKRDFKKVYEHVVKRKNKEVIPEYKFKR